MTIDRKAVLDAIYVLSEVKELQVTVSESLKGSVICAGSALIGGIVLGPVGLALGGIGGSLFAAYKATNKYKSVIQVVQEDMTEEQKNRLVEAIEKAISNVDINDLVMLASLVARNGSIQEVMLKELALFLKNELQMQMISN